MMCFCDTVAYVEVESVSVQEPRTVVDLKKSHVNPLSQRTVLKPVLLLNVIVIKITNALHIKIILFH